MEEPLTGGRTTLGVVRIGDTVRRPRSSRSVFSTQVLDFLEEHGFPWSPRHQGVDKEDRDILTFTPGMTTDHPSQRSESSYAHVGYLLQELHQLTRGSVLAGEQECVIHGDAGPYNVVMVDGLPATLIDWHSTHPGQAIDDVGYAGWTWCVQSTGNVLVPDQARRLRALRDGYDTTLSADELLNAVQSAQSLIRDTETANADDSSLPEWRRRHARAAVTWAESDSALLFEHRNTALRR